MIMYLHKLSAMENGSKIPLEFHAHESKTDELWRVTFVKYTHGQHNNK